MTKARVVVGRGQATNNADNDRIEIDVGVRDGTVVSIGDGRIRTGMMTTYVGGETREVSFQNGAEARALGGETFTGCEVGRHAVLILNKVFIGRAFDECLAVTESEVSAKIAADLTDDRGCVSTVLAAVKRALLDVQVTALAEAVVNATQSQPSEA